MANKPEATPEPKPKRAIVPLSPALRAMNHVERILTPLSEDDRGDVIAFFARRYLITPPAPKTGEAHVPHS